MASNRIVPWVQGKIEWSDDLLVGLEADDDDHREMFALMNRIFPLVRLGGETMANAVADLCRFSLEHFTRERAEMERVAYPGAEDHCYDHDYLVFQLDVLIGRLMTLGPDQVEGELVDLLRRWLCDHILTHDAAFAVFLKECRAGG